MRRRVGGKEKREKGTKGGERNGVEG